MTSFNPAAPGTDPTTAAPAANPANTQAPTQPGVVIEYNGRKFTQEDVLNKLANADQFIEQLKAERAEDRKLLSEATAALRTTVQAKELLTQTPPAAPALAATPEPVDMASVVEKAISQREVKQTQEANWRSAQDAMTAAYGDKADAKAAEVAKEVGMTVDGLVALAKTSPAAFKRLFPELSTAPKTPAAATPKGGFNSQSLPVQGEQKPTSGYWEAKSGKDQVSAYLNRLKQLSGA